MKAFLIILFISFIIVIVVFADDFITYYRYKRRADYFLSDKCTDEERKEDMVMFAMRCFRNSQYSCFHKEQHRKLLERMREEINKRNW